MPGGQGTISRLGGTMSRKLFLHVVLSSLFIVSLLASVFVPGPAIPVKAASSTQPVTPMVAAGYDDHNVGLRAEGTVCRFCKEGK